MNLRYASVNAADLDALYKLNQSLIEQYEDLSSIDVNEVLPWVRRKLQKKQSKLQYEWQESIRIDVIAAHPYLKRSQSEHYHGEYQKQGKC